MADCSLHVRVKKEPGLEEETTTSNHEPRTAEGATDYQTPTGGISDTVKKEEDHSSAEEDNIEETTEGLSHKDAMNKFKLGLAKLIKNDPLLCDLPEEITLEEVNSQIALEYGQAMTVVVRRADNKTMAVVVVQNGTVLDLKKAIRRQFMLKQTREGGTQHISWRYVWRTYWLDYEGEKLTSDNKPLKEYGIRNRAEVTFVKRKRKLGV